MGAKTEISWCDSSWNPIRGCSVVSTGCKNCYAASMAYRFSGEGQPYEGLAVLKNGHASWTGEVQFVEERLLDPLRWTKPRRIFVNSMSDLFHPNVTDRMRDKIFAVMALAPRHTFQVLTKRPELMLEYFGKGKTKGEAIQYAFEINRDHFKGPKDARQWTEPQWPLPSVWLGVSTEDQKTADERIPLLLETPAAIRFISAEPLLGPIDIRQWIGSECRHDDSYSEMDTNATVCRECDESAFLDWVIVGGESGPHARPMNPMWARSLRDQCKNAGVPFFFKQFGEFTPVQPEFFRKISDKRYSHETFAWANDGTPYNALNPPVDHFPSVMVYRTGKKSAGDLLDGAEWHDFPEVR